MGIFYIALFVWPFLAPNMLSLIVIEIILALIVGVHNQDESSRRDAMGPVGFFFTSLIIWFLCTAGINSFYNDFSEEKTELTGTTQILSLRSQMDVSGTFRLGYGTVGTSPAYQSMKNTTYGGFEAFIIEGKTILYEDADVSSARVEEFVTEKRKCRNLPKWVIYISKTSKCSDWQQVEWFNKLHVPKGTVLTQFSVQ